MVRNGTNGSNGFHGSPRSLKSGVWAPIPSFFLPGSEDLDLPSFKAHVVRVVSAGVGPLIAGSMGEAIHLSHSERVTLIQAARNALDDAGNAAAAAGADYAIVIASGYFAGALSASRTALKDFFVEISETSPIPVMIYNYPGASGGIDLDSDLITELAMECPNLCGVKLTCGNVGKLTRIADTVSNPTFITNYPRKVAHAPFLVLGGFIDFLVPSTFSNGHGAITGLGNVAPHAIARLFKLSQEAKKDLSLIPEAQRLQGIIARADFTIAKASISGTKYLLEKLYGYGGVPRKPLPPIEAGVANALWNHEHTQDLIKLEREASGKTKI